MSALGNLVGQVSSNISGSDLTQSISYITAVHSLPATNPQQLNVQVVSLDTAGLVMAPPAVLAIGGNASALTIGYAQGSAVSQPAFSIKSTYRVFHTSIQ